MQGQHGPRGNRRVLTPAMPGKGGFFRFLSGACLALLLCSAPPALFALTIPAGDLAPLGNPDGELDAADYLILQRFILGTLTPTPEQHLIADVAPLGNPDGELNVGDLVVLMRAIHGQIELPPVYLGPDAPILNAASGSTNDNPYILSGTAEAGREVRLYLNGALYATATAAGADGGFEFRLILRDGMNQLYAATVGGDEEGPASEEINLEYINDIPREQGGVLAGDTVWTPGAVPTPYVITSTLNLAPGATLTIMPGTVLRFGSAAALEVDGTLIVAGDSLEPVTFTSDTATPAKGDWGGIRIRPGSQDSRIDGAVVEYATNGVSVDGGQLHLSNCVVRAFETGWGNYGIGFINGSAGVVEDCVIDNSLAGYLSSNGIYMASGSQPKILRNNISNVSAGIFVEDASPWVATNIVRNNRIGIYLMGNAQAFVNGGNVIRNNSQAGIQFDGNWGWDIPGTIVKGNSILDNRLNVYISGYRSSDEFEIDLTENWWGSVSPSVISSGIFDHKDVWGEMTPPAKVTPYLDGPAGQPVSGNFLNGRVSQDTILDPGSGPYAVLGSYVIAPDVVLGIPPGIRLEFSSNSVMHVRGILHVYGETDNWVVLTSSDDIGSLPPGWGVLIGDLTAGGIVAEGSVSGAWFENLYYATEVGLANVLIEDSHYSNTHQAIRLARYSSGSVTNNVIQGQRTVSAGGTQGIEVATSRSVEITKNAISGVNTGISVRGLGRPTIRENSITGTVYGIALSAANPSDDIRPIINGGNTITGNDYGIASNRVNRGVVSVNHNNIFGNGVNYDKQGSSLIEDATNNWWNTDIEAEVATGIHAQIVGTVTYVPFLSGPVPVAPVLDQSNLLTNDSSYSVYGNAQPGTQVRIYVNSVEQLIVDTTQDGVFTGTVSLVEGENSIYAEAFNATTNSSPSRIAVVRLDTVPPVIDLMAPVSGDFVNVYPLFTGTVSEPSVVTIAGQSVDVVADGSFRHGPVPLTEGDNNVEVIATDLAGNIAIQTIVLTLDTTPPADPDMDLVTFGPLVGGMVAVTGAAGAIEAGAVVHVTNARTGQVAVVFADENGTFTASISAQPGDTLSLVVTDGLGNQTAWSQEAVSGVPPVFAIISIDPPSGTMIAGNKVTVSGAFQGAENVGIVVAGHVAQLEGGHFMASDIPLNEGVNNLDIVATTLDGDVHTYVLSLTSTGFIPFTVTVSPDTGMAPLAATIRLFNETGLPIQSLQYDLDDDGSYELSYSDLDYSEVWITLIYNAGIHKGRVRVTDSYGDSHILPFGLVVEESIGVEALLRVQYQRLLARLRAGNVQGALNMFMETSRGKYEEIFGAIGGQLSAATDDLGVLKNVTIGTGWAELLLVRDSEDGRRAYRINMIRTEDGLWRFEEM